MEHLLDEENETEIVIRTLTPEENGDLKAVLIIPKGNFAAQKLFLETFFEKAVKQAHFPMKSAYKRTQEPA